MVYLDDVRCKKHDTHAFFLLALENSGIMTFKKRIQRKKNEIFTDTG